MNCAHCGTQLQIRNGRWDCPRCDFWKNSYGERDWAKHAANVQTLHDELTLRFPHISWQLGLGAIESRRLDIPPAQKSEADLQGFIMREPIVLIEVSGSARVSCPPNDPWIRPGKMHAAIESGLPYYFVMFYPNGRKVIPLPLVEKHQRNVTRVSIKSRYETYIAVPSAEVHEGDRLFQEIDWLQAEFWRRKQ